MEKVHTFALKMLLNVSPRTPNGETGRFPVCVHTYTVMPYYNGHFKATTKGLQYAVIAA